MGLCTHPGVTVMVNPGFSEHLQHEPPSEYSEHHSFSLPGPALQYLITMSRLSSPPPGDVQAHGEIQVVQAEGSHVAGGSQDIRASQVQAAPLLHFQRPIDIGAPRVGRKFKACRTCRKHKLKCERNGDGICLRCLDNGTECVFDVLRSRRREAITKRDDAFPNPNRYVPSVILVRIPKVQRRSDCHPVRLHRKITLRTQLHQINKPQDPTTMDYQQIPFMRLIVKLDRQVQGTFLQVCKVHPWRARASTRSPRRHSRPSLRPKTWELPFPPCII